MSLNNGEGKIQKEKQRNNVELRLTVSLSNYFYF